MKNYICIHGHFYQPPRENAWLEEIELQESAHPYHDWNERITAECYGPNTASRILNPKGHIIDISNNYAKINFNFGPTLLSWMERHSEIVYNKILDADKLSMEFYGGHGSAIAQVYNHIIMPLASRKDKETQVIWGIKDFEYRFKRFPEGMWLAETAADTETLEVLAEYGIKYTILAPGQAKKFRFNDHSDFTSTEVKPVFSGIPYKVHLPSGKFIYVFFYDGEISQAVAFNNLLGDGKHFAESLLNGFRNDWDSNQLVTIATDGESYGHHHKHGDMALAYCLEYIKDSDVADLTNYGQFIEIADVLGEAEIVENSSWSCMHGIERWRDDCGCNSGGNPEWNQKWRKPLRDTLNWLRDEVALSFENDAKEYLVEPTNARNKYIEVIQERNVEKFHKYLSRNKEGTGVITKGLRWLELQRHSMLMFTSCGWFFDEVSGIETIQILQYASRLIQLYNQVTGINLEPEFLARLSKAPSNLPDFENAGEVYNVNVIPTRLTLERVGMHYAATAIFTNHPVKIKIFNYSATKQYLKYVEGGTQKFVCGIIKIRSNVTYSEKKFLFAALYLGQHNIIGNISINMTEDHFSNVKAEMLHLFEESRIGELIGVMEDNFGGHRFTLWHLFRDQKQEVINKILNINLNEIESSFRRIYNRDYQLINMMKNSRIPIPGAYHSTIEYVLNADLRHCMENGTIDLTELERIQQEFEKWSLIVDEKKSVEKFAGDRIFKSMSLLYQKKSDTERIVRLNTFFNFLKKLKLSPELNRSQNLYFLMAVEYKNSEKDFGEKWNSVFELLGANLGIRIEDNVL